jgi:hypothetical protein
MVLLFTVLAMVGMIALPAGAAPVNQTSYTIAECPFDGNPQNPEELRVWASGPAGLHIRGAENLYHEYLLEDEAWTDIGTNRTVANVNASKQMTLFGTFDIESTIGDFQGTWSWGAGDTGRASGRSDDGRLLKVTLGLSGDGLPALPGAECGVAEYVVFSK